MSERTNRCRVAVIESLLSFVGLGPDPGQDKTGYKDRVWPNDNEFHKKEMAFGERNGVVDIKIRQSSCAIVYEQACAQAGFEWPMTWGNHDIKNALKLSLADRLNKYLPPLYPVVMAGDFFKENGGCHSLVQKMDLRDAEEIIQDLFQPGNAVVQGLRAGGPPGSIWGKNNYTGEHVQGIVSLDEIDVSQAEFDDDEAFTGGFIFVRVTVVEGGMPGVEKNERVFVLCSKRGEIWACKNREDATPEVDWRPRRGRRVSFVHNLDFVSKFWTDKSGDVSPTGIPEIDRSPDSEPDPEPEEAKGLCLSTKSRGRSPFRPPMS